MVSFDSDFTLTINGRAHTSKETLPIVNPSTRTPFADAPRASREDLDTAVSAASAAFPGWRATKWEVRADAIRSLASAIRENKAEFYSLLAKESGKTVSKDAVGEVDTCAIWLDGIAAQPTPPTTSRETPSATFKQSWIPLGVCGVMVPWNYPFLLLIKMIAPALLAGNTVIAKPAPSTPLCTLKLGELARELLPPGVLNIVSGGDELGPWISGHQKIAKVGFTGSTRTGQLVARSAAESNLKRVLLELGGNDAAIVLDDVDVKKVAPQLFWAMFKHAGQICVASKRVYVHEKIYDALRDELVVFSKTVRIGDALLDSSDIGPLQNEAGFNKTKELIDASQKAGLKVIAGGEVIGKEGWFLPVHMVDNPPDDSRIVQEEPFGPICPLLKFSSDDEVIARTNASSYGLASSVWTSNTARAEAIATRLEAGTVWVNQVILMHYDIPFGGHKMSGTGVQGGEGGLLQWMNPHAFAVSKTTSVA